MTQSQDIQYDRIIHEDTNMENPQVINRLPYMVRRSPLMVTLGDPSIASQDIQKMLELGINIVKFRTSQCSRGERIRMLGKLDKAVNFLTKKYAVLDWPITTCIELKTCIVKTGFLEGDEHEITLKEGSTTVLIYDLELFDKCTAQRIFVDNPYIAVDVKVGITISIGEDEILLRCVKIINDKSIKCLVTKTGKLTVMCSVAVKGESRSSRPLITKKDLQIVTFAMEYQIDMIIINYARRPEAIKIIKDFVGNKIKRPILLAGVCTLEGLKHFDGILKESDGIVFSREFLAYELDETSQYRLLHIQKMVCAKCQQAGKPFFVSGEIFKQALITGEFYNNELSDITNALLDGATGFILKYCRDLEVLLDVIKSINELCCSVEPFTNNKTNFWRVIEGIQKPVNAAEACAIACTAAAHQTKARLIIVPTVTGYTAKTLMWLVPACLVITVSTKQMITRRLQAQRCVVPLMFPGGRTFTNWYQAMSARVEYAVEYAVANNWIKLGDAFVTLQRGSEDSAYCDMVRIWYVSISQKTNVECPDDTGNVKYNRRFSASVV